MEITNKFGLPESFLDFARADKYSRGNADISVTTLIDSPRVRLLREEHADDISRDASDMIWALFGTAVHHVLESTESKSVTIEERLYASQDNYMISGAVDHQEVLKDGTVQITDYKVTSVWSVLFDKPEWVHQQNCYAWLVEKDFNGSNFGRRVSSIRICAILRDWSRRKAQFEPDYPRSPVVVIDLPLWSRVQRSKYIAEKVELHKSAEDQFDYDRTLPPCSNTERWARQDSWAVKKIGQKRALKVLSNEKEAKEYSDNHKAKTEVEHRRGEQVRCEGDYCSVSKFCNQFMNIAS